MRNIVWIAIVVLIGMSSCNEKNKLLKDKNKMKAEQIHKNVQKPGKPQMTEEQLNKNVSETLQEEVKSAQSESSDNIKAALEILAETQKAVEYIQKNEVQKAEEEIAKIIGQLEVLVAKDPKLALIPVDVQYETRDLVADIQAVYTITEAAQKAMDEGYYQAARKMLNDLASEIVIKTYNLPLATYPDAMKLAVNLLNQGKKDEALAVLVQALNTLVIVEQAIPLPVLRAEEYIKAAALIMEGEDENKIEIAVNLLDNADYQLKLAEALGYGKRDKEYKALAEAIKELKNAIQEKQETKDLFDKLKKQIEDFKQRLFFTKKEK